MKKEVISERQGVILIILFIIGSTLLIGSGGQAKQDAWISIIIAISWALLLFFMYSRILSLYPGKDLFDILKIIFGEILGKVISIIMIWYAFHLGALVMRNLAEFTSTVVLPDTPVIVIMSFLTFLLIWGVKEGLEVLGRWAEFFIWVVFLLFLGITGLSIAQMDINNVKPILAHGYLPVLEGALSAFTFPFGETVIFTMVFSNIAKIKKYNRTFILGLLIGGSVLVIATLRNIMLMGSNMIQNAYFPSYLSISFIHIGRFLQRLEITVLIIFLICAYVKIIMCLLAVCKGVSKLFNLNDYGFLAVPISALMLCLSFILFKSTMEMVDWAFKVYPYYSLPFEVLIPLVVYIRAEFLRIKSTKG